MAKFDRRWVNTRSCRGPNGVASDPMAALVLLLHVKLWFMGTIMRLKFWFALLLLAGCTAWADTIDFEVANGKCMFTDTHPLSSQYAYLGVSFSGGGTALDRCGNFGVSPHSGLDVMAFHMLGFGTGPEVISFAEPVANVSVWVTSTAGNDTFRLADNNGLSASVLALNSVWTQLSLTDTAITQVTLSELGGKYLWLADDLSWTTNAELGADPPLGADRVPEPGMLALLGSGFGALGVIVKRTRN